MKIKTQLQRKDPRLPVYVVVPGKFVQPWGLSGTTIIEGTANGFPIGRRTIKAWGKGIDDWFVEFTAPFCKVAGLNVGDDVILELQRADISTPEELQDLLARSKKLDSMWMALPEKDRRDAGEFIRAGKVLATRQKRASVITEKLQGNAKK
jgi:hypothetical protein